MAATRKSLPLDLALSTTEMAKIWRGLVPAVMEEKWFAFFEDGVLHLHCSSTGNANFRVYFEPTPKAWVVVRLEVTRHSAQHNATDDDADAFLAVQLLRDLLSDCSGKPREVVSQPEA